MNVSMKILPPEMCFVENAAHVDPDGKQEIANKYTAVKVLQVKEVFCVLYSGNNSLQVVVL